jgi:hypothetical protein
MQDGIDVQTYTEDRLKMAINHRFTALFDEYWWEEYTYHQELYTLDGMTGQVTADLTNIIRKYADIQGIFNQYSLHPLPRAPSNIRIEDITNPCVQAVPNPAKVFRILPVTETGDLRITYRRRPARFTVDEDVILLDDELMILGSIWDIMEDDSTNPGAADKFRAMYMERKKLLEVQRFQMTSTGTPRQIFPTRWS